MYFYKNKYRSEIDNYNGNWWIIVVNLFVEDSYNFIIIVHDKKLLNIICLRVFYYIQ